MCIVYICVILNLDNYVCVEMGLLVFFFSLMDSSIVVLYECNLHTQLPKTDKKYNLVSIFFFNNCGQIEAKTVLNRQC